jgi:DNA-directed RNA polymerase III subunit RPC7
MAGRGRGRGGFGGGPGQLKGATWEHDATIKLESKPSDLFPVIVYIFLHSFSTNNNQSHPNLKRPAPLSDRELNQIKHYKCLQTQIHRGPLFTQPSKRDPEAPAKTFSEVQFNNQYGNNRQAEIDPFNGVETYSMRYAPKKNVLPKLSDRPFST